MQGELDLIDAARGVLYISANSPNEEPGPVYNVHLKYNLYITFYKYLYR